jgi:hypothetical protein
MVTRFDRRMLLGIPVLAAAGIAGLLLWPSLARTPQPDLKLNLAVTNPSSDQATPETMPTDSVDRVEAANLDRVRLSRQSFRRGGMGSQALMTFTVRNGNDYDIKDLELLCAFKSRDGRYTTERRKLLAETVGMKSRKAFPTTLIGHINIRASRAKCALVTASRA